MGESRIIAILLGIALAAAGVYAFKARQPQAPCVTHVPDSRAVKHAAPCSNGAHVEVVDHVALCVCPPAPAHTGVSDGDE